MNPFTRIGPNLALRLGFACGAALSAAAASAQSLTYTPYAITTVAGEPGNSGNANGTGTGAQFNSPYAVAADASGNAYVADTGNNSLRKVTPAGVVTTFAGVTGNFQGIAIDAAGANLYLTNNATGSITKVVISSGAASTLTLTGGTLNQPVGIGLDSAGNIYVADAGNYVIRKISPAGAMTTLAGSLGNSGGHDGTQSAAQFGYPAGIAVDSASGTVYVADSVGNTIRKVTSAGVVTTLSGLFGQPGAADGSAANALFTHPFGVAEDSSGNVYVADDGDDLLREISSAGVVTTLAGQNSIPGVNDGTGSSARFSDPRGIAVNASGTLYIADGDGSTVRKGVAVSGTSPSITTQPSSQTVNAGTTVSFTVVATGTAPLSYQWQKAYSGNISGGTSATLQLPNVQTGDSGLYLVTVSNSAGSATSNTATLTVNASTTAPAITTQPASQTVSAGSSATFTVAATGSPAPTYQWYYNGLAISGATAASYAISNVQAANAGSYYVIATNSVSSATSSTVTLTVNASGGGPAFTTQPASQAVNAGAGVTLNAVASGATGYQWQLNGSNIAGATNSSLTLANVGTTQRGSYAVVATNSTASTTSSSATVSVSVNSFLFNISTYGYVGSGTGQDLDAGFFVYGSGTKNILVMGAGPNLANASNGGSAAFAGLALASPELTFDSVYPAPTSTLGTNAAWGGGATLTSAMKAVYAPVFVSNSNDTAFTGTYATSGSNGYTVDVTINSGGPGLSLVEVDDVDSFKALPTIAPASYLANISTRGYVGASGGVSGGSGIAQYEYLDAGFTIFGTTSQTVLIRAVGPSLSGAPAATLAKPKLTLYDSSGNVIATNTGWGNAPIQGSSTVAAGIQPATTAIMNSVYASTITPGSADCAMVVTLPSGTGGQGAYTATVTSADGASTGLALVEVYNLP